MSEQKFLDNEVLSKDFMSDYNLDGCFKVSKLLMKKYNRLKN